MKDLAKKSGHRKHQLYHRQNYLNMANWVKRELGTWVAAIMPENYVRNMSGVAVFALEGNVGLLTAVLLQGLIDPT
jgi:hypothetical protein